MITSLVQLLCRTTKLCWFDDDNFRNIVEDAKAFLTKGTGGSPVSPCGTLPLATIQNAAQCKAIVQDVEA